LRIETLKKSLFVVALSLSSLTAAQTPAADQAGFDQNVAPFIKQNCAMCHNEQAKTAGLALTKYHDTASMIHDRVIWERVVTRVKNGEMPPKGLPRPNPEQAEAATKWIEATFDHLDATAKPDPGHLTAHRLNRTEYNNTIRDLLGVHFQPAADFPADDSGFGFDNIGDALSVSPVLMEKYLAAAKKIATEAIPIALVTPKPTFMKYSPEHLVNEERTLLEHTFDMPAEGEYEIHTAVGGSRLAYRITVLLDGKEIKSADVLVEKDKPRNYDVRMRVPYGEHTLRAEITPREPTPEEVKTAEAMAADAEKAMLGYIKRHPEDEALIRQQKKAEKQITYMDTMELRGPFNATVPPPPASYSRVFICNHPFGEHTAKCMREDLAHFAKLAYRRPVTNADLAKIDRLMASLQKSGMTSEQAMRVGVEAVLVSPNFIYRLEQDPAPRDAANVHPVSDYELASRLSYFLWSSTPDEELMTLADRHELSRPEVLDAQVKRMLQDNKSVALVDNFGGQWLELRNLDSLRPDPDQFPQFDKQLRKAMYTETHMFVTSIIKEDRSIVDFLDGKYTFLNERLAKFYGIPGVSGDEFRRVSLDGTQRSGVLTQASVLTVTSYPTRTSPVMRGKWILENVLNTPPPPPPPGVGSIDAKGGPASGTMRQQMEKHRANPICAGCHMRMDPLGFSLENYNAIGQWRAQDAGQTIDASGKLPGGTTFTGSAEMKAILAKNKDAFAECLTEKLMIYALGRGLEGFDRAATKKIAARLAANDYKFSSLITGIVQSVPFQMGRGDGGVTTE
jgi:mono/diheme cytochrome c family protein